ncbi:uncharacterized protein LOC135964059 [Calliphora vicina]|uniref:uncharacterized protein LOC135964059 n=1 Tax=Calliphora vicina TaxID=7373 RepID=UPI00325A8988
MNAKTLNHLRVVIHINEQDLEDRNVSMRNTNSKCGGKAGMKRNINGHVVPPSPPIRTLQSLNDNPGCDNTKAEVLLIDDKSLQLNLLSTEDDDGPYTNISHKMHFDHVSHSTVEMIKCELAIVMDDLLLKHKNSCIMRFATKQEMDITIFFDLFITFLNKRIYHQKYKLQYVKLECLDIAASLGNSKNPPTEKGFAMRANLAGLGDNSDDDCNNNDKTFRLTRNAKNEFRSTRDLLMWLLNEYNYKFSDNKGHEKLLFTFSIVDHHQNLFKVKLSLFNIYLDLMNTNDRSHWHHYMDHMGEGCQGLDCNFIHSGLTISLSGHIEGISSQNTLLLFDVPTNIKMTADTIEMLQMAHSVITNRKRKHLLLNNNVNLNRRMSLSSNDCTKCIFPQQGQDLNNNLNTKQNKERRSSLPLLMERQIKGISLSKPYNINHTIISKPLCDNTYSSKDFNTLSGWYRKIDERFRKICQLREKYFNRYFELKIKQISTNIQHMFKSLESLYIPQTQQGLVEIQDDQIELHELFDSYHNVRSIFRQLSVDIKDSDFEEILKIYLETKAFDLNKHALALKEKHLDLCQQHLKFTFNNLSSDIKLQLEF